MTFEPSRRQALRIRVGRLLDGTGGPVLEDAALLVIDGTIAAVGPDAAVPAPDDARTLELAGTTALPGLMDAHVHVTMPPTRDPQSGRPASPGRNGRRWMVVPSSMDNRRTHGRLAFLTRSMVIGTQGPSCSWRSVTAPGRIRTAANRRLTCTMVTPVGS